MRIADVSELLSAISDLEFSEINGRVQINSDDPNALRRALTLLAVNGFSATICSDVVLVHKRQ